MGPMIREIATKRLQLAMPMLLSHRACHSANKGYSQNPAGLLESTILRRFVQQSPSDHENCQRHAVAAATASCAGGSVLCSRCAVWLRSSTLSRLRHFQIVCEGMLKRSAGTQAGSSLAWIAARIFGVPSRQIATQTPAGHWYVAWLYVPQYPDCHEKSERRGSM